MIRRVLRSRVVCLATLRIRNTHTIRDISERRYYHPDLKISKHHDLASFLEYATRVGLDPNSTVYRGTHYEYTAQEALRRLSISTERIGSSNDCGIDLLGTWNLPSSTTPFKVFVQCKILCSNRAGPVLIRELEGAYRGLPINWAESDVIGMLVTAADGTKGMRDALQRSQMPMMHVACTTKGRLVQMSWNKTAENHGLAGIAVGQTYLSDGNNEIRITWKGKSIMA